MKNCTEYWKKRAKLAEAVIAENQIGAWKTWKDFKSVPHSHEVGTDGKCLSCKEKITV